MSRGPSYTEDEARAAVAASRSYAEALRRLGLCPTGGAGPVLRKWCARWGISTEHFDPHAAQRSGLRHPEPRPLEEILVAGSTYSRSKLKRRLFDGGIKKRLCELCGQGEEWQGRRMSLILDHVNGVSTDNRLANLRIVCPNCNATLDTHCGRNRRVLVERDCELCGTPFLPSTQRQRFCSRACGTRSPRKPGVARPGRRKVERPPFEQLLQEVDEVGFSAVGRKYGVSDNAIRKWLRQYRAEEAAHAPQPPPNGAGP